MAADKPNGQVGLGEFLELTGQSISEAQGQISPLEQPTQMMIGNAEVEVKVAVAADPKGGVAIQTISAEDLRQGDIDPGVLSTLRINFVATAAEPLSPSGPVGRKPRRKIEDVIKEVRERSDLSNLAKVLGPFTYEATYIPSSRRWLVVARDSKERLVREAVLPDETKEKKDG